METNGQLGGLKQRITDSSLKNKIMLPVAAVVVLTLILLTWYIMASVNSLAVKQGVALARAMAGDYGNEMRRQLETASADSQNLADIIAAMKNDNRQDRALVSRVIKATVEANPKFLGGWTVWEPNAFDGADANYVNTPGHDATGRFIPYWNTVGGLHLEASMDYDKSEYYQTPLKTGQAFITPPTVYQIGGKDVMVVSLCSPIKVGGKTLGVAGIDISMDEFARLASEIKPFETGFGFLLADNGMYVAHPDAKLVGKNIADVLDDEDKGAIVAAVKQGEFFLHDTDKTFELYFPLKLGAGTQTWTLAVSVPKAEILKDNRRVAITAVIASVFGIALLIFLIYFIVSNIVVKRLDDVIVSVKDIAEGEGDLTKRLFVRNADEIGTLSRWFNAFMENLEKMVTTVKETAIRMDTSSGEVSSGSQSLSQSSQEQASAVEQVAATIEEMTSSVKQNANNAISGMHKGQETEASIKRGDEIARQLLSAMVDVSGASRRIGDIIDTVNEVAFQTNLLALNAAVEAARAGEHGKGFAVVAEEVRALAQRSAEAAAQVRRMIEDTVLKIQAGDTMVKKTAEAFVEISAQIETLSQTLAEISAASNEQSSGIEELNRAITQIDSSTQMNAGTVEELSSAADSLAVEASTLARTVERFKVSTVNVAPGSERRGQGRTKGLKPVAPPAKPLAPKAAMKTAPQPKAARDDFAPEGDDGFEEF